MLQDGLASDANSPQVAKSHFNAALRERPYLMGNPWSPANLRRLALGGQTFKNLRSLACKFELDLSERKSSQVHASHGQTESPVIASLEMPTWA